MCVVAHLPTDVRPEQVSRERVRGLFLARQRFWPDGSPARPVNLPPTDGLREAFSRGVLGRGVRELSSYWSDRYFHGTRPPPTLASPEAVLLFLARTPGAVGYVGVERTGELEPPLVRLFCLPGPPLLSDLDQGVRVGGRQDPRPHPFEDGAAAVEGSAHPEAPRDVQRVHGARGRFLHAPPLGPHPDAGRVPGPFLPASGEERWFACGSTTTA